VRLILIIIIFVIIFVTGLGLGFSISLTMNPQTYFTGYLLMMFSGIGVLVNILNLWTLISKEIKLEFGKITKDNNNGYFIRVQQKSGKIKGKAINVESRLTLENTNYEYAPSVWADEKKKVVNIGEHEDLFLFKVENDTIVLPSSEEIKDFKPNPFNYNDVSERNLKIVIFFENGISPKPCLKSIKEIINSVSL
jgi:hypothetical protein